MRLTTIIVAAAAIVGSSLLAAAPASAMPFQSDFQAGASTGTVEQVRYYGDGNSYYGRHHRHSPQYVYDVRHGYHSPRYIYDVTHGYHSRRYESYARHRRYDGAPSYGSYRRHPRVPIEQYGY